MFSKYTNFGSCISIGNNSSVSMNNGEVNINGKTIKVPNNANISVNNGVLYVNGKKYEDKELENKEVIAITIEGNVNKLDCKCAATVNGNISKGAYSEGSMTVNGDIEGGIGCGGSCTVEGKVNGNVDCGGCCIVAGGQVGNIDAGGSVRVGR
jgi:hypothetical protein